VLVVDRMLVGGIKFVLGKVVAAAEAEWNDDSRLREELLAAQMRVELGEMTQEEFAELEGAILARLREIRERQRGEAQAAQAEQLSQLSTGEVRVSGVEASVTFEVPGDLAADRGPGTGEPARSDALPPALPGAQPARKRRSRR
jgi:hypothetical protein